MRYLKQRLADLKQQEVDLEYLLKLPAEGASSSIYSTMLLAVHRERIRVETQLASEE
jgi:hypothetical protein